MMYETWNLQNLERGYRMSRMAGGNLLRRNDHHDSRCEVGDVTWQ